MVDVSLPIGVVYVYLYDVGMLWVYVVWVDDGVLRRCVCSMWMVYTCMVPTTTVLPMVSVWDPNASYKGFLVWWVVNSSYSSYRVVVVIRDSLYLYV